MMSTTLNSVQKYFSQSHWHIILKASWFGIIALLFLVPSYTYSQPAKQWQKLFGGTDGEFGYSITQTHDGGFVITGSTTSDDGDFGVNYGSHGTHGGEDFGVIKMDSLGSVLWSRELGGLSPDVPECVIETFDGCILVTGIARSSDGDVIGLKGQGGMWVVKLDSIGNILWSKTYGGSKYDYGIKAIQTIDTGFVLIGWCYSSNGDIGSNNGGTDACVFKLSSRGDIVWRKVLGGTGDDVPTDVIQTSDAGFAICGWTSNQLGQIVTKFSFDTSDFWLVKLDHDGETEWVHTYGGSGIDQAESLLQMQDGGYTIVGFTNSSDGDVIGYHPNSVIGSDYDEWVVRTDIAGSIIWQKTLGGSGSDQGGSIAPCIDGGVLISGHTSSFDGDVGSHIGNINRGCGWLTKISDAGVLEWQKTLGGINWDVISQIALTADGGHILCGHSANGDSDLLASKGMIDFWVVKLAPDSVGAFLLTMAIDSDLVIKNYDQAQRAYTVRAIGGPILIDSFAFAGSSGSAFKCINPITIPKLLQQGQEYRLLVNYDPLLYNGDTAVVILRSKQVDLNRTFVLRGNNPSNLRPSVTFNILEANSGATEYQATRGTDVSIALTHKGAFPKNVILKDVHAVLTFDSNSLSCTSINPSAGWNIRNSKIVGNSVSVTTSYHGPESFKDSSIFTVVFSSYLSREDTSLIKLDTAILNGSDQHSIREFIPLISETPVSIEFLYGCGDSLLQNLLSWKSPISNYSVESPNPFTGGLSNESMYSIKLKLNQLSHIRIRAYTIVGQFISSITDDVLQPGEYNWKYSSVGASSTTYLFQLLYDGGEIVRVCPTIR